MEWQEITVVKCFITLGPGWKDSPDRHTQSFLATSVSDKDKKFYKIDTFCFDQYSEREAKIVNVDNMDI